MSVFACCVRAPRVVDGGVDTAVDQVVEANFVGYDRPVPVPIYLVKCENSAQEIEGILLSYKPDYSGNVVYGREAKALWSVRQRAEECLTILRYTGDRASTALGDAVDTWDENRPSDRAYFLDGGSLKSLQRCIAYQYSGAVGPIKQLLCEPSAYTTYPVAVEHALVLFRFMVEHMSTMYLAFWAEPRGFTDLRACIHTASNQELPDEEEKREQLLDLLESLKDLDDYFQGLKFQYLRSRIKRIPHPPPWPQQMPTHSEMDRQDQAHSTASLGSVDHEYAAISSQMDYQAPDAAPNSRDSSQNQFRKDEAHSEKKQQNVAANDLHGSGSVHLSKAGASKVAPTGAKPAADQQQADSNTVSFMGESSELDTADPAHPRYADILPPLTPPHLAVPLEPPEQQDKKSFMSVGALPAPPPPARNPLSATNSEASVDEEDPNVGSGAMKPGAMGEDTGSEPASSVANRNRNGDRSTVTSHNSDATAHPAQPVKYNKVGAPQKGKAPENKLITHTPMDASSDLLEVQSRMNGMLNTQMTALQTGLHTRRPGKSRPGSPKGPSPTATVFSEISGSVANLRRPVPSVAAAVAVAAMQANGRRATEDRTPTHTPPDSGSLQSSVHNNKSPFAGSTNAGSSAEHESYKKSVTRKKSGANDALPRKETFSALPEIAETPNESPVSSPGSDAKKMKDELGGVVDSNENVTKPWLKQASDNPFAKGVTPADQGAWERSGEEAERRPRPASSKKPPAADSLAGKQAKKQSVVANWIMAALNGRQSTGTGEGADDKQPDAPHTKQPSLAAALLANGSAGHTPPDSPNGKHNDGKYSAAAAAHDAAIGAASQPTQVRYVMNNTPFTEDNPFQPEDASTGQSGAVRERPMGTNNKRIKPPLPDSEPHRTLMNAQTPPRHSLETLPTPHEETPQNSGPVLKHGHLPSLHARTHDINAPSATDPSSQPIGMETGEMAEMGSEDEGLAAENSQSRPSLRKVPTQPISPLSPLAEQTANSSTAADDTASSPEPLQPGVWATAVGSGAGGVGSGSGAKYTSDSANKAHRADSEAAGNSLEADMAVLANPESPTGLGQYASEGEASGPHTNRSSRRNSASHAKSGAQKQKKSLWGAVRDTLRLPTRSKREQEALSAAYESDGISSALLPGMPAPAMMIGGLNASGVLGDSSTLLARVAEKHKGGAQRPNKSSTTTQQTPEPPVPAVFSASAAKASSSAAATASGGSNRPGSQPTASSAASKQQPNSRTTGGAKQPNQTAQRRPERRPSTPPVWDDRFNSSAGSPPTRSRKPSLAESRGSATSYNARRPSTGTAARPRVGSNTASTPTRRTAAAAVAATKFPKLKDRNPGSGIRPRLPPGDGSFLKRSDTIASSAALQTVTSTVTTHSRIPVQRTSTMFSNVSVETVDTTAQTPTTVQHHRRPTAFGSVTRPSGPNLSTANRGASRYRLHTRSSSALDTGGQDGSALHSVTSATAAGAHARKASRISSSSGAPKRATWR